MSARRMHDWLNQKSPSASKEKHHGNKRRLVARMKVRARRAERAKLKQEGIPHDQSF